MDEKFGQLLDSGVVFYPVSCPRREITTDRASVTVKLDGCAGFTD
jgi:hypothetical protein